MEEIYNDIVTFETAKLLDNILVSEDKYAAEDLETTMDNYLGCKTWKEGDLIDYGEDNIHGKFYYAPTYASVIDWLLLQNIFIEFIPCFTFATKGHIAYYWKIWFKNEENGKIELIHKELNWMATFHMAIFEIIRMLKEKNYII